MVKLSNKRLHGCVVKMMELEEQLLKEEMKHAQPHVFSREFEQKMKEVMRVQERVCKRSDVIRYVASAAAVVLLVFGLFFIGNEDLRASDFRIHVLEWMEDFFVVENDTNRNNSVEKDVLFEESQIGYIPDGFEKVMEEVQFSYVSYKYRNDNGEYISIIVYKNKTLSGVDKADVFLDVDVNDVGLEYRIIYKADSGKYVLTWMDESEKFYSLTSSIDQEEIVKIMNSISY